MKKLIILILVALVMVTTVFGDVKVKTEKIVDHDFILKTYLVEERATLYAGIPLSGDWFSLGIGPNFLIKGLNVKANFMLCFTFHHNGYFDFDTYDAVFIFSRRLSPLSIYSKNVLSLDEYTYFKSYKAKHYLLFKKASMGLGPEVLIYNDNKAKNIAFGIALEYVFGNTRFEIFAGKEYKSDKNTQDVFSEKNDQSVVKFELGFTFD